MLKVFARTAPSIVRYSRCLISANPKTVDYQNIMSIVNTYDTEKFKNYCSNNKNQNFLSVRKEIEIKLVENNNLGEVFLGVAYTTIFGIVLLNSDIDSVFLNLLKHDHLMACGFLSIGVVSPLVYPYKMLEKKLLKSKENTEKLKEMIHILNNKYDL